MTEPISVPRLLSQCTRQAWHLEMRDGYMPDDPEFLAWQQGQRFDPADRVSWWRPWLDTVAERVARGVQVRRARIISEPVSDYIRFEYDISFTNIAAGEEIRWLPRRQATDIPLPGNDFWLFDGSMVLVNHFSGNGDKAGYEMTTDPLVLRLCATAFELVWHRATPHEHYRPA